MSYLGWHLLASTAGGRLLHLPFGYGDGSEPDYGYGYWGAGFGDGWGFGTGRGYGCPYGSLKGDGSSLQDLDL